MEEEVRWRDEEEGVGSTEGLQPDLFEPNRSGSNDDSEVSGEEELEQEICHLQINGDKQIYDITIILFITIQ